MTNLAARDKSPLPSHWFDGFSSFFSILLLCHHQTGTIHKPHIRRICYLSPPSPTGRRTLHVRLGPFVSLFRTGSALSLPSSHSLIRYAAASIRSSIFDRRTWLLRFSSYSVLNVNSGQSEVKLQVVLLEWKAAAILCLVSSSTSLSPTKMQVSRSTLVK